MEHFAGRRGHYFCVCHSFFADFEEGVKGNAIMPA